MKSGKDVFKFIKNLIYMFPFPHFIIFASSSNFGVFPLLHLLKTHDAMHKHPGCILFLSGIRRSHVHESTWPIIGIVFILGPHVSWFLHVIACMVYIRYFSGFQVYEKSEC